MFSSQNQTPNSNDNNSHSIINAAFANALLDPDVEIPKGIGKNGKIAPKRFSVYRNNVVVSLMEAMRANYPSLHAIMGDDNFTMVTRNYILSHPPTSPMMQNFGYEFPGFLCGFKPLAKSLFLADIAQVERWWLDSHHASDASTLTPENLSAVNPDKTGLIMFKQHPATHLLKSKYPIYDFFNARFNWDSRVDMKQSQSVLITRPELDVVVTIVGEAQAEFFKELLKQSSLGEAIGSAISLDDDFDPSATIALLLETGAFKSINISN